MWVVLGFPERDEGGNLYNSAMAVNHQLKQMHVIRKVFLFGADKTWAVPEEHGSGIPMNFKAFDLYFPRLDREIKTGLAICMDINWKDFEHGK